METVSVVEIYEFAKVVVASKENTSVAVESSSGRALQANAYNTMSEAAIEVLCKHCGQTFSAFLAEMAAKNYKALCPCCGQNTQYSPSDIVTPPAARN